MSNAHCDRCDRRLRNPRRWNGIFTSGVLTGVICPSCQSAEENAEAEINAATLSYSYEQGRHGAHPKVH